MLLSSVIVSVELAEAPLVRSVLISLVSQSCFASLIESGRERQLPLCLICASHVAVRLAPVGGFVSMSSCRPVLMYTYLVLVTLISNL